jgi:hypothetical protein
MRMLHVDDLVERGPELVLLSRLPPFPWLHLEQIPLNPICIRRERRSSRIGRV